MVKRAFVLVLLQVCFCFKLDMNVNNEIMKSLSGLKTSPYPVLQNVSVPGIYMNNNPSRCVSTFRQELQNILSNWTTNISAANNRHNTHLQNLKHNLEKLGLGHESDVRCTMTPTNTHGRNSTWIRKYIHFLQKLNNNR